MIPFTTLDTERNRYMDTDRYKKAVANRDAYIKEHPHLKEFQDQIDDALNKCSTADRAEVLMILLGGKMNELREKMNELQKMINA